MWTCHFELTVSSLYFDLTAGSFHYSTLVHISPQSGVYCVRVVRHSNNKS